MVVQASQPSLPDGVHLLSKESQEALARAKEKGDAAEARHVKRAS